MRAGARAGVREGKSERMSEGVSAHIARVAVIMVGDGRRGLLNPDYMSYKITITFIIHG